MSCDNDPGPDNDEPPIQAFLAQFFATEGNKGYMSVCDEAFKYSTLYDIEHPLRWAQDANRRAEPGLGCDGLLDYDNDYMMSTGGAMLHEMLHWPYLLQDVPNYNTVIEPAAPDGQKKLVDYSGPDPLSGYGPFNALQIRNLLPSQQTSTFQSAQNPDNYVYYALSKYWSFTCGRAFGPPVSKEDNSRRSTPNY